ncbi:MAG: cell surface protein SprA, partial [bacterium]
DLITNVDTTLWGRVPTLQALVDAFDNNPASRPFQDVGYDGLKDADEITFFGPNYLEKLKNAFGVGSQAFKNAAVDPSADNYHYFRGTDYDNTPKFSSVLERYKKYNGPDGNSPTAEQSPENYPTLATTIPNVEDINKDNTLSESERYFQYVVQLNREQMKPGRNYITNVYLATDIPLADGTRGSVKWYQFKIPIRTPDKVVGNISDYTSIRFMRTFFKGFSRPIVCRFATMELSRGEWRRYNYSLLTPGEYIPDDYQNQTTFDLATVSIEENGSKQPIPYVMPPGIERETNWGSINMQQMNEQSMVLKVCNLVDGDARAAYKTMELDFRQFKKLQMFVHAEQSIQSQNLKYGDLNIFMRIGSDFTENFYEYDIPLTFTPWGTGANNPDAIWPEVNAFNIDLERLVQVKYDRNIAMRQPGSTLTTSMPFVEYEGPNRIAVVGSPTISDVKAIMIGIRNPKKNSQSQDDDGQAKCAEIWVDELRLTDFNKQGGWAATARIATDLADFGRLQLSGSYSSAGFGALEEKQTQRLMEAILNLGIDVDLELGKFFPEKAGIRIPMHFDYSMVKNTPKYDPLNPDLYLKDVVNSFDTKAQKDSIRSMTEAYTQRKNFNLMNVRKERMKDKKPKIWDIENFNVSYSYSEIYHRDVDIEYDLKKHYIGSIGYTYSANPKSVQPFAKSKALRSKSLSLIRDFNFYYLPRSFTFRTEMNREFNQRKFRNKSSGIVPMETFYIKRWDWSRLYDLKYDFSKSLKISLVANANAFINEPPGKIDRSNRDQVWSQIFSFGTMSNYNQAFSITWEVPINKIPILDFINISTGYQATFKWNATPVSIQPQFGNVIENSNTKVLNGGINLVNLYNKIPYLKRINQGGLAGSQRDSKLSNPKMPGKDQKPTQNSPGQDSLKSEKPKKNIGKIILDGTLRILMAVRNAKFAYTQGNGISLPGFMPEPDALGNNWTSNAPGLPFIFGDQKDIRQKAVNNQWLTNDPILNTPYNTKFNENLTVNISVEPIKDLRIEINAMRTFSKRHTEIYRSDTNGLFNHYSPMDGGSFTMSYIVIGTSFDKENDLGQSETFEKMKQIRLQIAQRYAAENPNSVGIVDSTGYPMGYGPTNQEVLTTAFMSAYRNRDPAKINLTAFPKIPFPNWRITYDGLAKLKIFKSWLRTFTLSHAYISSYTVTSYNSNIRFLEDNGFPAVLNDAGNFIPREEMTVISITEQFNPLFKMDLGFVNSLLANFELKRGRNLSFSFANNQMTEISSNEMVVGLGYRFKNLKLNFSGLFGGGKKSKTSSDLNLKLDFSIRQNKTVLRKIDQDVNQISVGQQVLSINFSADYNLSQKFNIRFYFDKVINSPYVSNQYRTSNTKGGIALRFTLSQ